MRSAAAGLTAADIAALGAAVAPPDAVAATAVARGIRMPRRVVALLEGESLFNDAAALTVLTAAVGAVTGESLSFAQATGEFLFSALGGLVIGGMVAVAWVRRRVRNPYTDVVVFLIAPLAAFLPADVVGASGLVAVVTAGLYLGHRATTIMEPGARVVTGSVRTALSWLLEGVVFLLVGLQLREVVAGTASNPLRVVVVSSVAVVVTLLVAVTLAAVLALPVVVPDGQAFPQRDLIVFLAFVVILATLQAQTETADSDPSAFLEPRSALTAGSEELPRDTYRRYGQAMIIAERARLLSLRDEGGLGEVAFVRIQRELDLEQAALLVR
ncbi:sodium/hydrogen exchanger family protein [Pseudonocardia sediminis]|uniref:Sodium/hydrogen exchanger family protein n=1 Tax=Pseudonocardia sediminis TaxID=1397368 RepID=A0A4Q7UVD5_PSEST|nr:cation:proton antiporter [Pseudonocardia sediminis]RZT85735.1 sodium/hydrogen exchanger family protein [Pseudonocardia sediminis]